MEGLATGVSLRLQCGEREARRLLLGLVAAALLLVILYALNRAIGKPSWHVNVLLDLDGEHSLPSWFSSLQLALAGTLLLVAAAQPSQRATALTRFLGLAGAGLLFLSADEALGLHERISLISRGVANIPSFRGGRGVWVFAYGLIGLLLLVLSLAPLGAWLRRRPRQVRTLFLGFGLLVLGGVVLEVVGYQFIRNRGLQDLYDLQMVTEELLEMVGGSLLVHGALGLLIEEQASEEAAH
jgi:hypothetical membrane protein